MKKRLPKIILLVIIFCLGIGIGMFIEKKKIESKSDFASDIATKTVDKLKSVENAENIEDKKNALKDAYSEMEKISKEEIKIQEEIMKLESAINNEMNLQYLEDNSSVENDAEDENIENKESDELVTEEN